MAKERRVFTGQEEGVGPAARDGDDEVVVPREERGDGGPPLGAQVAEAQPPIIPIPPQRHEPPWSRRRRGRRRRQCRSRRYSREAPAENP